MKKKFLTLAILSSFISSHAQEIFSDKRPVQTEAEFTRKINDISYDIDVIIKTNKDQLKEELNKIEKQVEGNKISKEEADRLRKEKAEHYALQIEEQIKLQEDRIKKLINNKIEDNINFGADTSSYQQKLIEKRTLGIVHYNLFGKSLLNSNDQVSKDVFSSGTLSNLGVGLGVKTRLGKKDTSPLYWKSTLDMDAHFFNLNDNKTFENIDNKTQLVDAPFPLDKSKMNLLEFRFSNFIEYDFSRHKYDEFGNRIVKSRQSFYVGLGGFIGYAKVSKQLNYTLNGEKYVESTSSKFNVNHFTYGVGGYVGYRNINLRANYNINTVFKNAFAKQNVFTMGIGFDLY